MELGMTINSETKSEIIRLRLVEKWPVGTVAKMLGVHHSVVERLERKAGNGENVYAVREQLADDFVGFIDETLRRYPKVKSTRLFQMAQQRGYKGISKGHFRRIVKKLRPQKAPEAFLRLTVLRGEQGQVDWGDFGTVKVDGGERKLHAFMFTLSYCRAHFLKFFLAGKLADFEQGFIDAFNYFEGITKQVLLDNLKSGVIERFGKIIRYNSLFINFADHYCFEPVACQPRRGNEKGRVERGIRYVRDNFFEARQWKDIDDLNAQALEWCKGESMLRQWKRGSKKTVGEAYLDEKAALMPIPATHYPAVENIIVSIAKTPHARFDTNDYTVPAIHVQKNLNIIASTTEIAIYDGVKIVATHKRSYDKYQTIEDPEHIKAVLAKKREAVRNAGQHRLLSELSSAEPFLESLALRGQNMGGCVTSLLKLLNIHGAKRLETAISEVVRSGSSQLRSVHLVLQRLEEHSPEAEPRAALQLDERIANISVEHHNLSRYDEIAQNGKVK
jgi:transposase